MPQLCMLMRTLSEAHLKCVNGIRDYLKRYDLDWDLRLIDLNDIAQAPTDAWWVVFHPRNIELLPGDANQRACALLGKAPQSCSRFDPGAFAALAVQHLHEQGYHIIGVVDGRLNPIHRQLHDAVVLACKKHGCIFTSHHHVDPDQLDQLIGWLVDSPRPLAIYAYTDAQAAWLRTIVTEAGLRIPEDLVILGTGDQPRHCLIREPTLSSLAYPWPLLGEAAAHHLHHRILGNEPPPPLNLRPYAVSTRASTAKRGIRDPLVRRAHAWMKRHLSSRAPLQEAAAHCGCSFQSLCLHFQAELGISPKKIHDQLRCDKAVELLADPHRSMTDIAKRSGFSSSTALGVAFKRRHGCSPSEWRRATN